MRGSGLTRVAPPRWKLIDWIALVCADGATFCGTGPGWKGSRCSKNRSARHCVSTRSMRWMTSSKLPGGPDKDLHAPASLATGLRQIRVTSIIAHPLHRGSEWLIGEAGRKSARRLRTQRGNLRRRVRGLRQPCRKRRWQNGEFVLYSRAEGVGRLWRVSRDMGFFLHFSFCFLWLAALSPDGVDGS